MCIFCLAGQWYVGELWHASTLRCCVGELGKDRDLKIGGKLDNVVLSKR